MQIHGFPPQADESESPMLSCRDVHLPQVTRTVLTCKEVLAWRVFNVPCSLSKNVSACSTEAPLGAQLSSFVILKNDRLYKRKQTSNKSHASNFKQKMHRLCFLIPSLGWSKAAPGLSPGLAIPGAEHRAEASVLVYSEDCLGQE